MRGLQALAALAACGGVPAAFVPATSPLVAWSGRYVVADDGTTVVFDWASTSATLAVEGGFVGDATVTVVTSSTLAPNLAGRLNIYINGFDAVNVLVTAATTSYLVAAALPANKTSNVTLFYGTEQVLSGASASRTMAIAGFVVGGGGVLVPPPQRPRRLDVVGDSITAGSSYDRLQSVGGAMSLGGECAPWCPLYGYSQSNQWSNYLCRLFDANCTTTAWSGKGLIFNSGCNAGPTMAELYLQSLGANPNSEPWDFSRTSRPDALILNLGTNDFSCAKATNASFVGACLDFMRNVTHLYQNSPPIPSGAPIHFFLALDVISPVKPVAAITQAIAEANAAGLVASLLDMRKATADGCGGHPGPFGHWQMALQAMPQIKAALGW